MKKWPETQLGEVLYLDLDKERINPSKSYEMVGVLSYGKGLFLRESVDGDCTSYKTFYRLHSNHIVMSQLFGWEGALALSGANYSGKYVSTQFPTFLADSERLDRRYLGLWLRQPKVWKTLKDKSKGMGDRRRTLNPDALLTCHIPLPAICKQRQIATKVATIIARIDEAKGLMNNVRKNLRALYVTMAHRNDLSDKEKQAKNWKQVTLCEVITQVSDPVVVTSGEEYPHFGIYSFSKGLFKKASLHGDKVKASRLYRVHKGQFIYGRLNAYEGAFGMITDQYDLHHVSNEFPTFTCSTDRILPEFLLAYFSAPSVW